MLNRIFVILAILAGLAVILLTHFTIRPHIQEIIDTRDRFERNWISERNRANDLQTTLTDTENKLVETETELKNTQSQLASETSRADTQTQRANNLQRDLTDTRNRLNEAQQELARWGAIGLTVDQVLSLRDEARNLREFNSVLEAEKLVLLRVNQRLTNELAALIPKDPNYHPPLPENTSGTVLVVDPKWRFVVVNMGEDDQMQKNGVLTVSRDGKLIAKIILMTVYQDRSIANVMPGWEFGEIMEGDNVIYTP